MKTKYIFVTGGVLSGLGKGITAASIGRVLKARDISVNIQKLDQYLNVDAGTLNPAEHGETFVTYDGAETDLDLGHYERFLDIELDTNSSVMSGRVLRKVIEDERAGKYLGKTVQVVPHVTNAMQEYVANAAKGHQVHIAEIGGTVGDIEGLAWIEAIREFSNAVGRENCIFVHVVYVPYLGASGEFKTKPAQNAVRTLRSIGIFPDVLAVRSEAAAPPSIKAKLSIHTGVEESGIVLLPNAKSVYQVPRVLESSGTSDYILKKLKLKASKPDLKEWDKLIERATKQYTKKLSVGVIAKYMDNEDTYMSVFEALKSAAWANDIGISIEWINAETLTTKNKTTMLQSLDAIVVPGGFGERGIEGKIIAAHYAIDNNIPYLGLCLGMQIAVVAHARKHLKGSVASEEVDPQCDHPVIHLMEHQKTITHKGGTMRLGDYECVLAKNTHSRRLYGEKSIKERHRHRFEFNNAYREQLAEHGLVIAGASPDNQLVEIIELDKKLHPYFVATQFHPEFKSRPTRPHPLFYGLIQASKRKLH
ncbi:TPA: CTP synthase [Candidatus Saccharibacteria bacterium]|nr:CTP synthase [Candidatus Saccharibacteria bacterium]HIO87546.1 CTP synthase [Candidatus Saccharibacteria bacterium]